MLNKTGRRYKPSFQTDREIAEVLALEKEFAQYDMPKRVGKNYRTVLRHLQDLKKNGLIRLSRTEKSKKGGKERNIFTLTRSGLLLALTNDEVWENIDRVARNYADELPLIFGKWDFFIEKGLRDTIIARLQAGITAFSIQLGKEWVRIVGEPSDETIQILIEKRGREKPEMVLWRHKQVVGDLRNSVLGFNVYLHPRDGDRIKQLKEQMQLLQILKEESEIERYLEDEFKLWEKNQRELYENVQAWRQWFESLKKS